VGLRDLGQEQATLGMSIVQLSRLGLASSRHVETGPPRCVAAIPP
jgi:hypothetical protein